ncbi:MAG: putative redox protein [Saprospiraceae bacterium]|jgi:putative redox protein|uniref:OsmC family protein n=1 Tax=Candidatus Marifrigoribacter sp. Uisw_064 TaxID=3230970 RepID=UPI003AED0B3A
MTNKVTTTWKGNMLFESDNPTGNTVLMEAGSAHGGEGKGVSPKAMMLSSLAACSGLDVVSLLKKMRAEITDFNMEVIGELTEEHPKYYHTVHLDYHFYGTELKEDKITKAVTLSIDQYCGVMEMFRRFSKVTTKIYFHES